jgi:DUF1009 family protein
MVDQPKPILGIIAGTDQLPVRVVQACQQQGRDIFVVAFEGDTDLSYLDQVPHAVVHLGAVGRAVSRLKKAGVTEVVLAGRVKRPDFSALMLDFVGIKLLTRIVRNRNKGDDALLTTVVSFLEGQGFTVVGVETVLETLKMGQGCFGDVACYEKWQEDVVLGARMAREIGRLDIGQAVVVKEGIVLAVEGSDGTDGLLAHTARITQGSQGGVLVKMKKPLQEKRVDLPTIGVDTVIHAHEAGLSGIAVQLDASLIIDKENVFEKARSYGMFVVGIYEDGTI